MKKGFTGMGIPFITPFFNDSMQVDYEKLERIIDFLINEQQADSLIAIGTTGESTSLSHDEKYSIIKKSINYVNKRVPVIVATGTANTEETIEMTKYAEENGADGVLIITPYYIKPNQEGIYQHFKKIAANTKLPIIIYNHPGRTGQNIEPATFVRLSEIENIVGVKDCCGSMVQTMETIREVNKDFLVLTGEDINIYLNMCLGGQGCIAATGHIIGPEIQMIIKSVKEGDLATAQKIHFKIMPIIKLLFQAPNPAPLKKALDLMRPGLGGNVRLPLVPVDDSLTQKLKAELTVLGKI